MLVCHVFYRSLQDSYCSVHNVQDKLAVARQKSYISTFKKTFPLFCRKISFTSYDIQVFGSWEMIRKALQKDEKRFTGFKI